MIEGYHVVGHHIQETWEELAAKAGGLPQDGIIRRAVRDIRVLVAFLDADAGVFASLVDALTETEEGRSHDAEPAAPPATLTEAQRALIWPAKEFATVSELGAWVHQRHKVAMTDILAAAGKKTVPELTIATAKAAVEKLLAGRAEAAGGVRP